jgi:uncharacterized protein YjbI with pentapeptide repeats
MNRQCDLSGYPLQKGTLVLKNANLSGCYLARANLSNATATNANASGAYLVSATLTGANLSQANFTGAVISGANLTGANLALTTLRGAKLDGATLTGVTWSGTTCPDGTNSNNKRLHLHRPPRLTTWSRRRATAPSTSRRTVTPGSYPVAGR